MSKLFTVLISAVALSMSALVSCSDDNAGDSTETYNPVSLDSRQCAIAQTANDFSDRFFAAYDAKEGGSNYIISSLSVQYALAMTANGAEGEALDQLLNTMGYDKSELDALNEYCRVLMADLPNVSNRSRISIYNNMWYNSKAMSGVFPQFSNSLKSYFDAECVPSNTDNVIGKVNGWITEKSKGRITDCLNEIDPEYHSVIVNVLNFEGYWPRKLKIENGKFRNADGRTVDVEFLNAKEDITTYVAEMGYIFDVPYSKGAYQLRIILPLKEVALDNFIADLSAQFKNAERVKHHSCSIKFPKFKCRTRGELKDVLNEIGIVAIFDEDEPGITKMSGIPAYISNILQVGTIEVDENGTVITVASSEYPLTSVTPSAINETADRPFAFEVFETSTGIKLFQGRIDNL